MSNRIAVFDDGIIQQLASPEELYEKPDSAFVAAFIGENNRLVGDVTGENGGYCSVKVDGQDVQALSVSHNGVGGKSGSSSSRPRANAPMWCRRRWRK